MIADANKLMERTEELNRAGREQVIKSRKIITEPRRIMASIRLDVFGAVSPPKMGCLISVASLRSATSTKQAHLGYAPVRGRSFQCPWVTPQPATASYHSDPYKSV
jgi:hypothetical protein